MKPDAKLLLVGDGILRQRIENKAAEMGIIQKIMFLGKRRDVNEIYQAMDVFALPSLFEGLPMAVSYTHLEPSTIEKLKERMKGRLWKK